LDSQEDEHFPKTFSLYSFVYQIEHFMEVILEQLGIL
jgi:hypothetical protein